jgi:Tfp pilus assembly protein PilX
MLAFYNRETGAYLRNLRETETALESAEARIRQLEEELRRRASQG